MNEINRLQEQKATIALRLDEQVELSIAKNNELIELNNQCEGLVVADKEVVKTIPSMEVAKMMEIEHKHLLEKIDNYNTIFDSRTLDYQKYWVENTYRVKGNNKSYKCYECTKLGCDILANKMTGTKGILFTAKYVDKFNDMEKQLKQQLPSYQIDDAVERAIAWANEVKTTRLLHARDNLELEVIAIRSDIRTLNEEYAKIDEEIKNTLLLVDTKTYTTTEIAKECGFRSALLFNRILQEKGIQYRQNDTWVLKAKYAEQGFMEIGQGESIGGHIFYTSRWTNKGRLFLLEQFK